MLETGTTVGPYRILATLGAGGMGEVYRASDPRLGREVAIKVLPASYAEDEDRLRRFEQEARAVGSLNHPNLVTVFDAGTHAGTAGVAAPYLVMELLEGETLRDKLASRPMRPRRAAEIARGIAEGLGAAHGKGVIHRDLKPENVFVTRDGRVKILDFGVAKLLAGAAQDGPAEDRPTEIVPPTVRTGVGTIVGSVGYMSPEQVRGDLVDARSDLFSLGVILWEMLTGVRPFGGPSTVEAMHAIVHDDPPDLDPALKVPPVLERIARTALAKDPAARFHSAHDLAFALETVASGSDPSLPAPRPVTRKSRWRAALFAAALLATAGAGGAVAWFVHPGAAPIVPSFHKLTFGRGSIDGARFVPGSRDIAYSARWQGAPSTVYLLREGSLEPRAIEAAGAMLLATSSQGGAAVLSSAVLFNGLFEGNLSVLPLAGGGQRELSQNAFAADFSADGADLCIVRRVGSLRFELEFPQGEVLVNDPGSLLRGPRVSGASVAFFQGSLATVGNGEIRVAAKGGRPRSLAPCRGFTSLAWVPGGREVWFSTFDGSESQIHAVTLDGKVRVLARFPGRLELMDIDSQGRALAIVSSELRQAFGRGPGADRETDLTWLEAQTPLALQADGSRVLLSRAAEWEMAGGVGLYLRSLTGGVATKFGLGTLAAQLSPDGRWLGAFEAGRDGQAGVRLMPTGPGPSRWFPLKGAAARADQFWFHPTDGSLYLSEDGNNVTRLDPATGSLTENVLPGAVGSTLGLAPFSPDGNRMILVNYKDAPSGELPFLFAVFEGNGARALPAKGNTRAEVPVGWTADSREVYLYDRNVIPTNVVRWNPLTGARRPFMQITPSDPSGVWGISYLSITPSGNAYAYSVLRKLSDLYVIEGLK